LVGKLDAKIQAGKDCWKVTWKRDAPEDLMNVMDGIRGACDFVYVIGHGERVKNVQFIELGDSVASLGLLDGLNQEVSVCGFGCSIGSNQFPITPAGAVGALIEALKERLGECPCKTICIYSGPVNSNVTHKDRIRDKIGLASYIKQRKR
jgi:hypothetical protein